MRAFLPLASSAEHQTAPRLTGPRWRAHQASEIFWEQPYGALGLNVGESTKLRKVLGRRPESDELAT